jgi:hypothetical protein
VVFAASLGLIAVASTGLWASIDCLLVAEDEDLDLPIALARFTRLSLGQVPITNLVGAPPGRVYRGGTGKPPSWLPLRGTGT